MTAPQRITRTEARTRALEILFAADVRDGDPAMLLAEGGASDAFTEVLVDVVIQNRMTIDELITAQAEGWTLDRMPAVDRNVLRLGLAEMLYVDEVPAKVAIDEAVELAKALSTDSSPRFVNGVLAAIARDRGLL
ncbi:MAG TPA: transcription antitermination factor NusB [Euzebya sp.]|nr:transcription antitermination factor NusB [Euzebya sp.]